MRRLDAGTSGKLIQTLAANWASLNLAPPWPDVLAALKPGPAPRPVQSLALEQHQVLTHRRNLIVSSPTNSGKSLVGLLALLEAVHRGHRAVLLVPLRAIAREKLEELESLAPYLSATLGRPFAVRISTGDYRLEDEVFAAPPPDQGEIIIATPERFDAILRNPTHDDWIASIAAVCVDEAHLISSPHRGSTLEYLLTYLLCLPAPPRLVLLSATLGNTDRAQEWLAPCDVISVTERHPPLYKEVIELAPDENASDVIVSLAKEILANLKANLLIFVYQTRSTERLAATLKDRLGKLTGVEGALAYHAQMSAEQRQTVRAAFGAGRSRCLVTTTALGLGVNLPATHVLVRDNTFPGVGPLSLTDLLQMMGRAGRGDQPGHALIIVRPNDTWKADQLAHALHNEKLPSLVSHFQNSARPGRHSTLSPEDTILVAKHVAAQLARRPKDGFPLEQLQTFFQRSLGGQTLVAYVPTALAWLTDPLRVLAWCDEQDKYRLTVLGLNATRAVLPLDLVAGFAQLFRDLLTVDPLDRLLEAWHLLDHLLLLDLLYDRAPTLRRFSRALVDQVDAWMEEMPGRTSLLYREWVAGQRGASRAIEVLGSLGIAVPKDKRNTEEWARRRAYLATFRAIILHERGQGKIIEDLSRRWRIRNLAGVEERWRDDYLWLLSGLAKILEIRCFYYHLREECDADPDRVRRVKGHLRRLRFQTFDLQEHLKYCSPLGPVLRSIRRTLSIGSRGTVGLQSIRRLEAAGIQTLPQLAALQVKDMVDLGVRRDLARQIHTYVRRRCQ